MDTTSKVDQVIARMRSMIIEQSFENGRLPSEPELSRQLGISRATVRQALSALATEGLIVRKHGVGTFVDERVLHIPTRIEEVLDFAEMIKISGYTPGVRHIELRLEAGAPDVNQKLGLDPAAEIITTANVFLADGLPAIYCIDKIPAYLVNQAYRDEELHGPIYSFLQKRCDQRLDHNITQILPVVADSELSRLLECPVGSPLHYFEEIGINNLGTPIIYSEVYYRPDYFSFHVIRKMTSTSQNL